MGRGGRRWIAVSGGVLINGLILAALVLVEEPPPVVEEAPVIILDLERPERHRLQRARQANASAASASLRMPIAQAAPSTAPGVRGAPSAETPVVAAPAIEPAWQVDPKAVERWRLTEGNPDYGWGRYYRACKGLSNEHMTPEEKERCYGGVPKPPSTFIGPIDRRKVWQKEPSIQSKQGLRQERCRTYRSIRTQPGADAPPMPSMREGGCF